MVWNGAEEVAPNPLGAGGGTEEAALTLLSARGGTEEVHVAAGILVEPINEADHRPVALDIDADTALGRGGAARPHNHQEEGKAAAGEAEQEGDWSGGDSG